MMRANKAKSMRKIIVILLLLVLVGGVIAYLYFQNKNTIKVVQLEVETVLEKPLFDSIPVLENDALAYFNGLGKWKAYKQVVEYFKDGTARGVYITKDSIKVGPWREWYHSGRENGSGFYDENGKKIGVWKLFDDATYEGKDLLIAKEHYKDDKLHGELKKWYKSGKLNMQLFYKNGFKNGECSIWYKSGALKEVMFYKLNKPVKNTAWHKNGQLKYKLLYNRNGRLHGNFDEFDENGNILKSVTYKNGKEA